ncbi:MAG: peptidoglycan-binding domain-containing protein [Pseudomonadota bacterium]
MRNLRAVLGVGLATVSVAACASLDTRLATSYAPAYAVDRSGLGDGPVNPRPGACYATVIQPPRYKTEYETVVVEPGGHRVKTIPARYETVEEQVLVQEATEREIFIKPTYKTVREQVVVRPGYEKIIVSEPQFRTITEEVVVDERTHRPQPKARMVRKERTRWVHPNRVPAGARVIAKGARNNQPAVLIVESILTKAAVHNHGVRKKTITRKELAVPQRTRRVVVPPKVADVTRTVVDTPGRVEVVTDPPKYETIRRRRLVAPAVELVEHHKPTTEDVPYDVLLEPAKAEWAEVLCETASTAGAMIGVQERLFQLGYYEGPIDGTGSANLRDAITAFQEDNKLATGGLTLETVERLGVL